MSWNELRTNWQHAEAEPAAELALQRTREHADKLRRTIRRRDFIEFAAVLVLLPVIAAWAWSAWAQQAWLRLSFVVLLGLWALYVPWRLWRTRRRQPTPSRMETLRVFLDQERHAMLAQARMLESTWRWYLAPPLVALSGMELSTHGATRGAVTYIVVIAVLAGAIHLANRLAARSVFRKRAAEIDQQLEAMP